jgi:uncharacterized RDD family membrane protein YckC
MKCSICGHDNTSAARFCANCGSTLITEPQPHVVAEPESTPPEAVTEYAGFWIRFCAAIIDGIILSVVTALSSLLFAYMTFFFGFILLWIYHWLFTGIKGQTPGKMLLGIKVVDVNGDKPSLGTAALREIAGKTISMIILFIGFLAIGMNDRKQGWHDEVSHTFVVKVETKKTEERDYAVP